MLTNNATWHRYHIYKIDVSGPLLVERGMREPRPHALHPPRFPISTLLTPGLQRTQREMKTAFSFHRLENRGAKNYNNLATI